MLRIVGAVVAGYASMVVGVILTFSALAALGAFGPDPKSAPKSPTGSLLVLILALNVVWSALGAWLAARIADPQHGKAIVALLVLSLLLWVVSSFSNTGEPMSAKIGNLVTLMTGLVIGWQYWRWTSH